MLIQKELPEIILAVRHGSHKSQYDRDEHFFFKFESTHPPYDENNASQDRNDHQQQRRSFPPSGIATSLLTPCREGHIIMSLGKYSQEILSEIAQFP